jgi:outer membrane protein TolC
VLKILRLILVIGLVQTAVTASAQNSYSDPVLDSLISAAIANNPGLKAAEKTADAMNYRVTPAGILPDPMFSVGFSGPIRDSWVEEPMAMPNITLGITQMIPFPGKLGSMKNAARYMADGSRQMVDNQRLYLIANVRSYYYDLAYWQSALQTVEERAGGKREIYSRQGPSNQCSERPENQDPARGSQVDDRADVGNDGTYAGPAYRRNRLRQNSGDSA